MARRKNGSNVSASQSETPAAPANKTVHPFVVALRNYTNTVQAALDRENTRLGDAGRTFPNVLEVRNGSRFVAVVIRLRDPMTGEKTGDPIPHSFVDKIGGDHAGSPVEAGGILYPVSLKAAARHQRGSIFADDFGASALDEKGEVRALPRGRGLGNGGRTQTFVDATNLDALADAITFDDAPAATV